MLFDVPFPVTSELWADTFAFTTLAAPLLEPTTLGGGLRDFPKEESIVSQTLARERPELTPLTP